MGVHQTVTDFHKGKPRDLNTAPSPKHYLLLLVLSLAREIQSQEWQNSPNLLSETLVL